MLVGLALAGPDDARLVTVAQQLPPCLRRADTLARYGVSELAVVLSDVGGEAECRIVAARVLDAAMTVARDVEPAIGIAVYSRGAVDAEALLRNADAAPFRARHG